MVQMKDIDERSIKGLKSLLTKYGNKVAAGCYITDLFSLIDNQRIRNAGLSAILEEIRLELTKSDDQLNPFSHYGFEERPYGTLFLSNQTALEDEINLSNTNNVWQEIRRNTEQHELANDSEEQQQFDALVSCEDDDVIMVQ
jgi:hypothetical protein